jgi:hypothetical protein
MRKEEKRGNKRGKESKERKQQREKSHEYDLAPPQSVLIAPTGYASWGT